MSQSPLRIFVGYDPNQPVATMVLTHSIIKRASRPVSVTPLVLSQLPIKRRGLTEFTFSRFLCPWLCEFEGWSAFLDADMLVLDDIYGLLDAARQQQSTSAVFVVKNKMRFEWTSLMLFNNSKSEWLGPSVVADTRQPLHDLAWASGVGELPSEWNHCVGYDAPRQDAKLVHFTQGIPYFEETEDTEYVAEWRNELEMMVSSEPWEKLMGNSVHAKHVRERMAKRDAAA